MDRILHISISVKKYDGNNYLKAGKCLIQRNKNTPESSQEHTKKAENSIGDLPEKQEAAPLPEAEEPQPLNESSPAQTQSQPLFNSTKYEVLESIYKIC